MLGVFTTSFTFNHNIVDIDFHGPTDQGFEDLCYQPLVGSIDILEPKRHDPVAVQSVWLHEDCFLLVCLEHGDMVVPRECVYEREYSMSGSGVNYMIYLGQ